MKILFGTEPSKVRGPGPRILFIFAFLATLLLYWQARNAGFVMDFIGWQARFENGSFGDILSSFGYPGLHQVMHAAFYTLYTLAGTNGTVWLLLFALLHALNGTFLYLFIIRLGNWLDIRRPGFVALSGSVLFLFSPYHAEVLVWKVCLHYLLSGFFLLVAMHAYWSYLEGHRRGSLILLAIAMGAALFTLELALVFPLVLCGLYILRRNRKSPTGALQPAVLGTGLPFVLTGAYLLLNRLILGSFVGHYGAEVHLRLDPFGMVTTIFQYGIKHLTFLRFASHDIKASIFDTMQNPLLAFGWMFFTMSAVIVLPMVWKWLRSEWQLAAFSAFGFGLTVLPISNLFFYYLQYGENDRYGYVPMMFLALGLASLCSLLPRWARLIPVLVFTVFNLYFTHFMSNLWHSADQAYTSLVEDFDAYDAEQVYLLGVPDNYRGIYMFRIIGKETGFQEALQYRRKKPFQGMMRDVMHFNMVRPDDSVTVEQIGEQSFRVGFGQWGNWWWREGIGASSYAHPNYEVTLNGLFYTIEFKENTKGMYLLYPAGGKWHPVPQGM